tara:strand:- start:490 stop:1011 length:522 start_codon:yes stop_codon:yes gene_type:complete
MKKSLTQKELERDEIAKTKIIVFFVWIGSIIFLAILGMNLAADEIKFQFKSPSFSGIGQSAHYLTVESQEYTRKEQLRADLKALEDQRKRDAENSVISRFTRNLESRIFAQISRQIVEQLFGENPETEGSFSLFDNIISWSSDGTYITLTIYNTLDETTTEITIPIGDFGFGG